MNFTLTKLFSYLLYPANWVLCLFLLAFLFRKKRYGFRLLLAGLISMYFFMNSFITDEALRAWESPPTVISPNEPPYDAGIVLSGGMVTRDSRYGKVIFQYSTDRFLQAVLLYKQKKIKKILLCGGDASLLHEDQPESFLLKQSLIQMGIPENDIITENFSKTTYENAYYARLYIEQLWPNGRFLLITSAYHMPRAMACFRHFNLDVTPYPTDFISGVRRYEFHHLLFPNPDNFINWNILLHEWVGMFIYRITGKI